MKYAHWLAPLIALGLGACGAVAQVNVDGGPAPDGGAPPAPAEDATVAPRKDGGRRDAGNPEDCEMPASLPAPPTAKACADRPGAPCVPGGWFCLAKWSPYWNNDEREGCLSFSTARAPKKLVWIDSYQLDAYEVTNADYNADRLKVQSPPPPVLCDDERRDYDPYMPPAELREPTGWESDGPKANRMQHPVACIPRASAAEYCKRQGGRLPTVIEYMRAGQREAPSLQRFPWGDALPYTSDVAACEPKPGFAPNWQAGLPLSNPVDTFSGNRGPYGHYSLSANVGEWVSTCREDLDAEELQSSAPTVIEGKPATKATCGQSVLIAGLAGVPLGKGLAAQSINALSIDRAKGNSAGNFTPVGPALSNNGFRSVKSRDVGPAGDEFISNQVGFRCAYDLP
jgi:formylglycine-generating enzyme required for sulfatase activity